MGSQLILARNLGLRVSIVVSRRFTLKTPQECDSAEMPFRPRVQTSSSGPVYCCASTLESPFERGTYAFHEKAGRSQVGSFVFSLDKFFSPPSCHCRHPSIRTLR